MMVTPSGAHARARGAPPPTPLESPPTAREQAASEICSMSEQDYARMFELKRWRDERLGPLCERWSEARRTCDPPQMGAVIRDLEALHADVRARIRTDLPRHALNVERLVIGPLTTIYLTNWQSDLKRALDSSAPKSART